ncbi:hypothetical protein ACHAXR_007342 [Thalassiosira sp. AJA248-18]
MDNDAYSNGTIESIIKCAPKEGLCFASDAFGSIRNDAKTLGEINIQKLGSVMSDEGPASFSVRDPHKSLAETRAITCSLTCLRSNPPHLSSTNGGGSNSPSSKPHAPTYSPLSLVTGTCRRKKHEPQCFNLGHFNKSASQPSIVIKQKASQDTPIVTIGERQRSGNHASVQDIGNYRMLIDDLSYLCSAIIQCRMKQVHSDLGLATAICKHTPVTAGAACDIAELISQSGTRSTLHIVGTESSQSNCGQSVGERVGALEAVLESIACAPSVFDFSVVCRELFGILENQAIQSCNDSAKNSRKNVGCKAKIGKSLLDRGNYDATSSKALSIVSYFVGVECTGSDRAALHATHRHNRLVVQLARKSVLQHKPALQGIARLFADDPVVHAYLHAECKTCTSNRTGMSVRNSSMETPSSLQDVEFGMSTYCDPTKLGRHSRKRRNPQLQRQDGISSFLGESPPHRCIGANPLARPPHLSRSLFRHGKYDEEFSILDFSPNEGGITSRKRKKKELHCGDRYQDKILLALSRAKLTCLKANCMLLPQYELPSACSFCTMWVPYMISNFDLNNAPCGSISASSLALVAADCIITGRDKFSEALTVDDIHDHEDICCGSEYSGQDLHGVMSTNPIAYANEMLRQSGSLPHYSRSMSETLAAILLSSNDTDGKQCPKCIGYLQHRASLLSEVIDSLCCLSPTVSTALSLNEFFLVPSLLRAIAELCFAVEDNQTSLSCESISSALKTLTSLTHENSVACNQILSSYHWKIRLPTSSQGSAPSQITGLDIIFSYLFKTVPLKQGPNSAHHSSNYDNIVFCLNILTNVVEMVPNPTKSMIQAIAVSVESNAQTSGISWLAQWVVSRTSGFQNSIMKGSFGTVAEGRSDIDTNELKAGEEDNLVISGNGFVLLACLMIDEDVFVSKNIRDSVIAELPIGSDGNSGGIQFMIKALKAFCNFYHYSVGDISVAVIAPVVKLITGLEKIIRTG